jgi:general secretion pathway protein G
MKCRTRRDRVCGFTLIEMVVVVAIIALIAGILMPVILKQMDDAQRTRALADCKNIASAIAMFRKDTGFWPTGPSGNNTIFWLYGSAGTVPTSNDFADGASATIETYMRDNTGGVGGANWAGPYIGAISADPWGRQYIVSTDGFWAAVTGDNVWVVSAGPNGAVDTPDANEALGSDDIGVMIQ